LNADHNGITGDSEHLFFLNAHPVQLLTQSTGRSAGPRCVCRRIKARQTGNSPNKTKLGEASDKREARNANGKGGLRKKHRKPGNGEPSKAKQTNQNRTRAEERLSRKGNRELRLKGADQSTHLLQALASGLVSAQERTATEVPGMNQNKKQPGQGAQPLGQGHQAVKARQATGRRPQPRQLNRNIKERHPDPKEQKTLPRR